MDSSVEFTNPYIPAGRALFYGREDAIKALLRNEQVGQSVVLIAGRRCGKTCMLERLEIYLKTAIAGDLHHAWLRTVPDAIGAPPTPKLPLHWPIFLNFQGVTWPTLESALKYIAEEISQRCPSSLHLPLLPPDTELSTQKLEQWLQDVDRALDQAGLGGLALLIDEVEETFRQPNHHDLFSFLRRLDDRTLRTRLWVVLVGSAKLDGYANPKDGGSPPLNIAERFVLKGLDYRARRRMTIEPFLRAGYVPLTDRVLQKVDYLAGGQVWLLTLLLSRLFRLRMEQREVTLELVESAAEMLLERQDAIIQNWQHTIGAEGIRFYEQIAQARLPTSLRRKHKRWLRILEYHGLVDRGGATIELGPMLFRTWLEEAELIAEPFVDRNRSLGQGKIMPPGSYGFDVAFIHEDTQEELVNGLVKALKAEGLQALSNGVKLWDLPGRLMVVLLNRECLNQLSTDEIKAIGEMLHQGWERLWVVSLDGTRLPGWEDEAVYRSGVESLVEDLLDRLEEQDDEDG